MIIYFLLLSFLYLSSFAEAPAFNYGTKNIELEGTLDLQTFPGPPNFESIENGDEVEKHFYLKLDQAVDVIPLKGAPSTENDGETERNVKVMQLSINAENDKLWSQFRKIGKGGHVKIIGTLFHRFTGHHHSRVLLNVDKVELRKESK